VSLVRVLELTGHLSSPARSLGHDATHRAPHGRCSSWPASCDMRIDDLGGRPRSPWRSAIVSSQAQLGSL